MNAPPNKIDGARLICFTPIDDRHLPTDNCNHTVFGMPLPTVAGLAICKYEDGRGFYLYYCDSEWATMTNTYHESIERAMDQAEFEFVGTRLTWQMAN